MPPLDCPFCEHQNPADAKFCNECGSPLHLAPCDQCGAVNSLADTNCWKCGGLLLSLRSPVRPVQGQREPATPGRRRTGPSGPSEPAPLELEQELAAIEEETRRFAEAAGFAWPPGRSREESAIEEETRRFAEAAGFAWPPGRSREESGGRHLSDATPVLDEMVAPRPPPALQRSDEGTGAPPGFAAAPLAEEAAARPRELSRAFVTAASVTVFVAAIAGGGYFYYRIGAAPAPSASAPPPEPPRVEAPIEPRVAREVGEAAKAVPPPAVASAAPLVDAPVESPAVSATGKALEADPARGGGGSANIITRIGTGTSAPEPSCPAAVAAMALCEWAVKADRQ